MVPMHGIKSWGLSMNLPGHRIAACLGKAALKTHALQTLRDRRASPNRAKRLECVRFIGAFRPARDGPRFMVPMVCPCATLSLYVAGVSQQILIREKQSAEIFHDANRIDAFRNFGQAKAAKANFV